MSKIGYETDYAWSRYAASGVIAHQCHYRRARGSFRTPRAPDPNPPSFTRLSSP